MYDFNRDLEVGVRFEDLFEQELVRKGVNQDWIVRPTGLFSDYDLKVSFPNDETITYEVKRDYYFQRTRNLLIELWSNVENASKGWFLLTKADVLVVFYTDTKYYLLRMDEISKFIERGAVTITKQITQKTGYHTRFYLLNVDQEIQQNVRINNTWQKITHKLPIQIMDIG